MCWSLNQYLAHSSKGLLGPRMSRCRLYYNEEMKKHTHEWPHIEKCTRAMHAYDHLAQRAVTRLLSSAPSERRRRSQCSTRR